MMNFPFQVEDDHPLFFAYNFRWVGFLIAMQFPVVLIPIMYPVVCWLHIADDVVSPTLPISPYLPKSIKQSDHSVYFQANCSRQPELPFCGGGFFVWFVGISPKTPWQKTAWWISPADKLRNHEMTHLWLTSPKLPYSATASLKPHAAPVDGRNPAPPEIYDETLAHSRIFTKNLPNELVGQISSIQQFMSVVAKHTLP